MIFTTLPVTLVYTLDQEFVGDNPFLTDAQVRDDP